MIGRRRGAASPRRWGCRARRRVRPDEPAGPAWCLVMLRFRWDSLRRIDRFVADDAPGADREVLPVTVLRVDRDEPANVCRWAADAAAA